MVQEKTCSIISLGCPKNLMDSETMIGRLTDAGFHFQSSIEAELLVLNTCGFLASAKEEAVSCLKEVLELKRKKRIRYVVVTGCFVQTEKDLLPQRFPEVDAWIDPFREVDIVKIVQNIYGEMNNDPSTGSIKDRLLEVKVKLSLFQAGQTTQLTLDDKKRKILTLPHTAYLRIADGCDRYCSYCAIPSIRGRFVSKPKESILEEAKKLGDQGTRELVLIAQETTFWGNDLYGSPQLADLLHSLRELGIFDWIRVLYSYPLFFSDELISIFSLDAVEKNDNNTSCRGKTRILPYIDLPLQHCNDDILKRMNRRVGKTETEELLARLRESIPNLILRTTFIVGFPGETDQQFEELNMFVRKWKFERAGVFPFSAEPNTKAIQMEGQLSEKVKTNRYRQLSKTINENLDRFCESRIGTIVPVIIDGHEESQDADEVDCYIGRTYADAPDIDPVVYITGNNLKPGSIVSCEIVSAASPDLVAVPVDDN